MLGLNLKESNQVAEAMSIAVDPDIEANLGTRAARLCEGLQLHGVVVHARRAAGGAWLQGDQANRGVFEGPFVRKPYLSTGAGDNFNAGFCLGLLAELPIEQALCAGVATSGYYVRQGKSPSLKQLTDFCGKLPEPEAE